MADVLPELKYAKRIEFEREVEYEAIKGQVEDVKKDIGTEENGAVLPYLIRSYFARWRWMGKK